MAVLTVSGAIMTGIVALGRSDSDGPAVAHCGVRSTQDYSCFEKRYRRLTERSGTPAAFRALKQDYRNAPFVKAVCHGLAHEIGRTAAERYGNVANTYARGDTFCGSGYYHGAMETIVSRIGPNRALAGAPGLCGKLGDRTSTYRRNCVHGLGHGFMVVEANEVPASLRACDRLAGRWEERNCYDGVFMQNIMSRNAPHYPSKYLKANEPMYPCTVVRPRYRDRCYERQTVQALVTQDGDFQRVFELCASVEPHYRGACFRGLGRDAAGSGLDHHSDARAQVLETVQLCYLGRRAPARARCIAGAAAFLVRQFHGPGHSRELCRALATRLRDVCSRSAAL